MLDTVVEITTSLFIVLAVASVPAAIIFRRQSLKKVKGPAGIEVEFADETTGALTANIGGIRRVYTPGDAVEQTILQTESNFGDVLDDKLGYVEKARQYALTRLVSIQHDVAAFLRSVDFKIPGTDCDKSCAAHSHMSDALVEMSLKLIDAVTKGMTGKLLEILTEAFRINGFYDMILYRDGMKGKKPEWTMYVKRQADTLERTAKHYLGNKLASTYGLQGDSILFKSKKDRDFWEEFAEDVFSAAWEHQHHYKVKQQKYRDWKQANIKSMRESGIPVPMED